MDEKEYKSLYQAVNNVRCVFEKAVLTRNYSCEHLIRRNLAEREAAGCDLPAMQLKCTFFLDTVRSKANFALGQTHVEHAASGTGLVHSKEMKIQCGCINALVEMLSTEESIDNNDSDSAIQPPNIGALVALAEKKYLQLEQLPFDTIMPHIARVRSKRRGNRGTASD